tara:strand:- start:79 stop:333 length:255 start_codon:yes stop_codon:yes gene_type:complete
MRATTITRAFVLNAIVLSVIAAFSIELRDMLDDMERTKGLSDIQKLLITMLGTFFIGIIIYFVCRFFFGLGEGMMATKTVHTFF